MSDTDLSLPVKLLIKEQEELNTWARIITQVYFAWYTFFWTLSIAALTWTFAPPQNSLNLLDKTKLYYGMLAFLLLSLLAVVATVLIILNVKRTEKRMLGINSILQKWIPNAQHAHSPIPGNMLKIIYFLCAVALIALSGIWLRLVWPLHF